MKNNRIRLIFIFIVISLIISLVLRVPVEPFLEYDGKDITLVIAGCILGAPTATIIILVVGILELIVTFTGLAGFIMNISATLMFVCILSYIYNKKPSLKYMIIGAIVSTFISCSIMIFYNYLLLMNMEYTRVESRDLIFNHILKFNVLKNIFDSIIVILIFKPVKNLLEKYNLLDEQVYTKNKSKLGNRAVFVLILLMIFVPIFLTAKTYL